MKQSVICNQRPEEQIDFAIAMCKKYNLKLVLDLHKTQGFYYDVPTATMHAEFFFDERYQAHFCDLWEELARRYSRYADRMVFDLLNEVVDASAVPDLLPPADDRVVYNFHCYDPQSYTHQGAYWVDSLDKSVRIAYQDSGVTEETFEVLFAPAIEAANERGTTLYCGEYGVIDVVPPEDAIHWCRAICRVFARHGIPHCMWNYKQLDFGLTDARWDALRQELIDGM